MLKFEMPDMEHLVIRLEDDFRFKPKKVPAEAVCYQTMAALSQLDLSDLATYFSPIYNEMVDRKIREKKNSEPVPNNDDDVA